MNSRCQRPARAALLWALAPAVALSMAHTVPAAEIAVPGERTSPESLTSLPDGSVIFGSVGTRAILRAKPGMAAADVWIQPGTDGIQGVFGVFADIKSNTLWACSGSFATGGASAGAQSSAPPGARADIAAPLPSALHAFNLETGAPKGRYPLPIAGGFCNDIALGADGTAYLTDTGNMQVVRLRKGAKSLEVWAGNGTFGSKGGVLDGIAVVGRRLLVSTLATSKLFSVPIDSSGDAGDVIELQLDRPLDHPDGMRTFGKNSVLIVENGSGGRLSRIIVDRDSGRVTTLKEGFAEVPVALTVVGTIAYVLAGQVAMGVEVGRP